MRPGRISCLALGGALLLGLDTALMAETAPQSYRAWGQQSRLLLLLNQPETGFSVQAVSQPGSATVNVAGAGAAGVAGNLIGNLLAAKMNEASVRSEQQKRIPGLVAFQEQNDTLKLIADAMNPVLQSESVAMVMTRTRGQRSEAVLNEVLRSNTFDQAVSLEQKLMLDDDLLSLRTAYGFSAWEMPGLEAKSKKKLLEGRVSIFFDYPVTTAPASAEPGAEVRVANWSAASPELVRATLAESGQLLTAFMSRLYRQQGAVVRGDYVIATTNSLDKVRGYRQDDIAGWSLFCDEGNNCYIMKPKKVHVLRKAAAVDAAVVQP